MYKQGELEVWLDKYRDDDDMFKPWGLDGYLDAAYLPHSGELWVIGGPNEIRNLIADLQKALLTLESNVSDGRIG